MSDVESTVWCSQQGCLRNYQGHRWGKMRAQREGWFFMKNGKKYCPDHVPEWVEEWRKKQ